MKFIVDAMLGRLATWMRILGCDAAYQPVIGDREIVERARREDRTILTRDTLLIRRRYAREHSFLVAGDDYRDQLRQVVRRFGIDVRGSLLTRCLRCNVSLRPVAKAIARGLVPPYVFATQAAFEHCPTCRKIYWGATHRAQMMSQLEETLGPGE